MLRKIGAFAFLACMAVSAAADPPSPADAPRDECAAFRQNWTGPNAKGSADSLYRSLMTGVLKGSFGEDPTDWPKLNYLNDDEMNSLPLSPDVLGTALPAWTGVNNTDRPAIIISQRVAGIACSSRQMMFVFAHEAEHHKARSSIKGKNHLTWIKDRKQALFEDWVRMNGVWWLSNTGKDDPYIADWFKQHKNDNPPHPLSDDIIRQKMFDAAMADKGPTWSADQRTMEREADAEGIEAVLSYYQNQLHQAVDRQEFSGFMSRMFEFEKKTNDKPQPYATHDPADQRAIQALDQTMIDQAAAAQQRRELNPNGPY